MSTYNAFYHLLILTALVLSTIAYFNGFRRFGLLSVLLFITYAVELTALVLIAKKIVFVWLYHIYNFIEYGLLCLFLLPVVKSRVVSKFVVVSIPAFIMTAFLISFFFYHFRRFPGININIEGMLLFLLCVYILFTLEVTENRSVLNNANFWICSGILIFFGTTFFYNGVYTKLLRMDEEQALKLFSIINRPLNIILYSFMAIGILCLPIRRKPFIQ
jgi:hypothetical protein